MLLIYIIELFLELFKFQFEVGCGRLPENLTFFVKFLLYNSRNIYLEIWFLKSNFQRAAPNVAPAPAPKAERSERAPRNFEKRAPRAHEAKEPKGDK